MAQREINTIIIAGGVDVLGEKLQMQKKGIPFNE